MSTTVKDWLEMLSNNNSFYDKLNFNEENGNYFSGTKDLGDYIEYNFQRLYDANKTADKLSEFTGSFNDIVRREDFNVMDSGGTWFKDTKRNEKARTSNFTGKDNINNNIFEANVMVFCSASGELVEFGTNLDPDLVITPESISESTSAMYNSQPFVGRMQPTQVYTGTGARTATISFKVHYEMIAQGSIGDTKSAKAKVKKLKKALAHLRASVYPTLLEPGYVPNYTVVRFGKFHMYGICTNITYNWTVPIIDGEYSVCEVSLSIQEVLDQGFRGTASILSYIEPQSMQY